MGIIRDTEIRTARIFFLTLKQRTEDMTQNEIYKMVAEAAGLTIAKAKEAVKAYQEAVKDAVTNDGAVLIPNVGTLKVRALSASEHRNPKTGEIFLLAERKKVAYKASKELTDTINGRKA